MPIHVAAEEGLLHHLTLSADSGFIGGQPASGLYLGAAINTEAITSHGSQFDFYDGGGLDMACLSMAEIDASGSVNVSLFGSRLASAGGFINISQNALHLVFTGSFTASGLDVRIVDGTLWIAAELIAAEGRARKFGSAGEQTTFSGNRARRIGQPVLYVTERCVLRLGPEGIALIGSCAWN